MHQLPAAFFHSSGRNQLFGLSATADPKSKVRTATGSSQGNQLLKTMFSKIVVAGSRNVTESFPRSQFPEMEQKAIVSNGFFLLMMT